MDSEAPSPPPNSPTDAATGVVWLDREHVTCVIRAEAVVRWSNMFTQGKMGPQRGPRAIGTQNSSHIQGM